MNFSGCDEMVGEYLLYRGFTKSFRSLEGERQEDRTRLYEASAIVTSLFDYLDNHAIKEFMSMWNFLFEHFFQHLDQENSDVVRGFKIDMVRYYLIKCYTNDNQSKIVEFFGSYSQELMATESNHTGSKLRSWYVLPYVRQAQKDPEFQPFFSPRFGVILRNGIQNYLSMVLRTTSPPKLLLIERWFRSENQQKLRLDYNDALEREKELQCIIADLEGDVSLLKDSIKSILNHMHESMECSTTRASLQSDRTSSTVAGNTSSSINGNANAKLFETDEEKEENSKEKIKNCLIFLQKAIAKIESIPNLTESVNGSTYGGSMTNKDYSITKSRPKSTSKIYVETIESFLNVLNGKAMDKIDEVELTR
jgi:WD repeat-containing protein 91